MKKDLDKDLKKTKATKTVEKKAEPKKVEKKVVKVKKEKKVRENYLKAVWQEMKKVKWPDTKEMVKYTVATIMFCLVMALYFQGLDFVSSLVKGLFN